MPDQLPLIGAVLRLQDREAEPVTGRPSPLLTPHPPQRVGLVLHGEARPAPQSGIPARLDQGGDIIDAPRAQDEGGQRRCRFSGEYDGVGHRPIV
jgi:hypothetical protein